MFCFVVAFATHFKLVLRVLDRDAKRIYADGQSCYNQHETDENRRKCAQHMHEAQQQAKRP